MNPAAFLSRFCATRKGLTLGITRPHSPAQRPSLAITGLLIRVGCMPISNLLAALELTYIFFVEAVLTSVLCYAASLMILSSSKLSPLFHTAKTVAVNFRATASLAISGRIPLFSNPS